MNTNDFRFSEEQFSKLFPFYLRVNDRLEIIAIGKTLHKMQLAQVGELFPEAFAIKRPETAVTNLGALQSVCNQMIVMQSMHNDQVVLRGQMEWLPETNEMLFVGTPWFGSMDQVISSQLTIHDFALHDPMIDLLHVLKTQEITNDDLKQLLKTVSRQKNELKQAARKVEDIARFPMQNPDPLVRVSFEGEVLMMNPAAEKLLEFEYQSQSYNASELWRTIAAELDHAAERWMFEVQSNGRTFSFVCKPIASERYFNVYGRDVTAQHEIERNLLISEQNFRVMGENIPGLIFLWRLNYDGSNRFEYMSPRIEAELGVPFHDVQKMVSYIHPEDVGPWKQKVQDAFADESPFEFTGRIMLPNGEVVWLQAASRVAYKDSYGKVFSGYFRNITEQRRQQLEFERLSLVASANKNGVLFTTPDGKITWSNDGFSQISGYSQHELLGKTPVELCRGPLTDRNTLQFVVDSFFKGEAFQADIVYYRKDGSWFWGRSATQPVKNEQGETIEFFGIIEDITQEKEQAEQLKLLSKIAEDNVNAVIVADAEGRIEWVNRSFETMTGYRMQEVKGMKPGHVLQGPGTDPATREYLKNQIANGEAFECEILNYRKDGVQYWLRIHGQALKDGQGNVTKFFAIEEDITAQKEAAQILKETEARFKLAIEKMGDNVWEHNFITEETSFSISEEELLGFSASEFQSNADLWWNCVVEEDRHLLAASDDAYRGGKQDQHSMEYRMRHKNGQLIWILDRGVVIERDRNGKPLRILGTHTNITQIKDIQTELAQRVNQFKSLSENIPGVIYEYEFRKDGTEGLRYISPAIEQVFGISTVEFRNYQNYIHPDDVPEILEKNRISKEQRTPFYNEARLILPGGREVWHSVSSSFSYYTAEGSAVFTGFMQDITERKHAEEELNRQRKFYEDILNNMPADIAVFSPNHEYLFVNPRGIKDPELRQWIIGKRDEDYCAYRNKPLSIAAERRATFNKVVEKKGPAEWEEKNIKSDSEVEHVLRRWYPVLNEHGEVSLVIGYGVDITKRKLAEEALRINEEKYRSILANMNLGLMEVNTAGDITYANQSLARMVGINLGDLIGYNAGNFISEEDKANYPEKRKRRERGISEAYEIRPVIKGKPEAWWVMSAAPKFSDTGEFIGTIIVCFDITAQKKLQQDLEISREQAQQLAKTKEVFLANMSHEIRTPMNAIIGLSRQLKKTRLDEMQTRYLDSISTASDNLLVIINDILDLSKIEAGKLHLENIGFKPKELLNDVSQLLQHRAEERGIWLYTQVDESLAPVLIGDPYRLTQIVMNLASNAIKFTERGGVTLGAKLIETSMETQKVSIYVTDTGVGMSEDFLAKLFEPFAQESRSASRTYGGTGLGLAISRQLVELMDGKLSVSSQKGMGSTFEVILTLGKGNEKDLPAQETINDSVDLLKGLRILLVEDNSMNRLVASTVLSQYGAQIAEAEHGEVAIDLLQQNSFDIVLMDMQMPVMDGLTATRLIRQDISNTLPIIALTANALDSERKQCIEAGMNDFITKPFEENALLHTIVKWTGREDSRSAGFSAEVTTKIDQPLYDLKTLNDISRGNREFVAKMARLFAEQAPALASEIIASYESGDLKRMGSTAHKLKPSIDNMGIISLKDPIRAIEKAGKEADAMPGLDQIIHFVAGTINKVVAALIAEFSQ